MPAEASKPRLNGVDEPPCVLLDCVEAVADRCDWAAEEAPATLFILIRHSTVMHSIRDEEANRMPAGGCAWHMQPSGLFAGFLRDDRSRATRIADRWARSAAAKIAAQESSADQLSASLRGVLATKQSIFLSVREERWIASLRSQ
jgi:hypothetical protein